MLARELCGAIGVGWRRRFHRFMAQIAPEVGRQSFGASANVRLYFDDSPVELAATDANGTLAPVTVHVPALAPGPHVVRAIDDRSGYPVTQPFTIH